MGSINTNSAKIPEGSGESSKDVAVERGTSPTHPSIRSTHTTGDVLVGSVSERSGERIVDRANPVLPPLTSGLQEPPAQNKWFTSINASAVLANMLSEIAILQANFLRELAELRGNVILKTTEAGLASANLAKLTREKAAEKEELEGSTKFTESATSSVQLAQVSGAYAQSAGDALNSEPGKTYTGFDEQIRDAQRQYLTLATETTSTAQAQRDSLQTQIDGLAAKQSSAKELMDKVRFSALDARMKSAELISSATGRGGVTGGIDMAKATKEREAGEKDKQKAMQELVQQVMNKIDQEVDKFTSEINTAIKETFQMLSEIRRSASKPSDRA